MRFEVINLLYDKMAWTFQNAFTGSLTDSM